MIDWTNYLQKLVVTALTPRRIYLNLQCQQENAHFEPYTSSFDAVRRIVKEEGFLSLFRGNEMLVLSQSLTPLIAYYLRQLLPAGNFRYLSNVAPIFVVRPLHFVAIRVANNYLLVTEVTGQEELPVVVFHSIAIGLSI
jgi:hypothetical protein